MFFQQRLAAEATLSYLFGCASCHVAVAVDPVQGDEQWFIDAAAERDVVISHVIDTHVHADHYSAGRSLAARCNALYCLHESNHGRVSYPFEPLRDQQLLTVGNVAVEIAHTPGHTPDSICLIVSDKRRTEEPWFVLTGDTIFVGAIGRPDLAGEKTDMAAQLHDSLHQRILNLPGETELFPGHTAGSVCGAGISGKPVSTIAFERRCNPLLAMDRDAFVSALNLDTPPPPADMARMVAVNLGQL